MYINIIDITYIVEDNPMQPLRILSFKLPGKPISLTGNQLLYDRKTFYQIPLKTCSSLLTRASIFNT